MTWGVALAIAVVVLLAGWYLSSTAGRLDRLNKRVEASRHSLETQLVQRQSVATELAASGLLDPASAVILADAASAARHAAAMDPEERAGAEGDLTSVLAAVFATPDDVAALRAAPGGEAMAAEVDGITRRVAMSRRFLNDGVRANRDLRQQRMVRWFRLAGSSTTPQTVEIFDEPPAGFGSR